MMTLSFDITADKMQQLSHSETGAQAPRLKDRRRNSGKRVLVDHGITVGRDNLVAGAEYLDSRGIEPAIVRRVLLALLAADPARLA
jgi:hypothetical protein